MTIALVGVISLGIFFTNFGHASIILAAILVYGLAVLLGLAALGGVLALYLKWVILPRRAARERRMKGKVLHVQDNAVIVLDAFNNAAVVPLLPGQHENVMIEQSPTDESSIITLWQKGNNLRDIAKSLGITYYQTQKIVNQYRQTLNQEK